MDYLFSAAGMQRLERISEAPFLCAFDFDGTLAPIVAQPDRARLAPAVREQLQRLMEAAPVAVISGRALDDLGPRLAFKPNYLVGNHGIEGVPGREGHAADYAALCSAWKRELENLLAPLLALNPGIGIEDKTYSLSVHYRATDDPPAVEQALARLFEQLSPPPHVMAGKFVFNIIPEGARNKGGALLQLMQATGFTQAVYVGDDVTDEDVFGLRRPEILGIRIGSCAGSAAEFFLRDQFEISRLLDEFTQRLTRADPVTSG